MRPNAVSYRVIGAAMKVHTALGAGILESAYEACLCYEFTRSGLYFENQVRLPIIYEGNTLSPAYTMDFVVEDSVVVEIKCVEKVLPVHRAQLLSYLRLTGHRLGLLINFNVPHLRQGVHRII